MYWRLIYLEEIIQIWIIFSIDINLHYIYKVYCREQGQHLMQQKKHCILKKYPTYDFFKNLVPKESFAPKGTFSIKLIGV